MRFCRGKIYNLNTPEETEGINTSIAEQVE